MLIEILDWATWIVPILLCGTCISLYLFRLLDKSYQRVLFIYLLISLIFDLLSRYWSYKYLQNINLIAAFAIAEILIFHFYYNKIQPKNNRIWISIALICYLCVDMFFIQSRSIDNFQTYSRSVSACYIVFSSIYYYIQIIKYDNLQLELIQLNNVIIIYYALNVILYLPINYILNVPLEVNLTLWIFKIILLLLFYTYLWKHLWTYGKKKKLYQNG